MGYSDAYVANMTKVHRQLRRHRQTLIQIVRGPDDLCRWFPDNQPYHCDGCTVYERDDQVLEFLDLHPGKVLPWSEVEARVARSLHAHDIPRLCATCPWLAYGVCEEGIERIRMGKGLWEV
ncbi:MAG: DUF1284 domain-containing protein [Alicyclobacillus herbarius]|nr:DUF1284 domain-containing protein [Alicyclobacillus herbarius]